MHPTVPMRPFLPYLFPRKGKDRAVGDNRQLQICDDLSVSAAPSQLPWKGSQGARTAGGAAEKGGQPLSQPAADSSPGRGAVGLRFPQALFS